MIGRRGVVTGLLGALGAAGARAQAQPQARRLAFLTSGANEARPAFQAFRTRLRKLGWVEGGNLALSFHLARGAGLERLQPLARTIAAAGVDAILADGRVATQAMAAETRSIPIVSIMGLDPTALGLATSLAHPGGNVTGISMFTDSLNPKRLELLRELVPSCRRVGVVYASAGEAAQRHAMDAGLALGLDMHRVFIDTLAEIDRALSPAALAGLDALAVSSDGLLDASPEPVVSHINAAGKPAIYPDRDYVEVGGLAAYGVNMADAFQRLAGFVDRILRGANPAEMPIERPDRFEFLVNLKTAKALGLAIPPPLLGRADEVIE
jgi:putative ABC transport system substrate-binding protein